MIMEPNNSNNQEPAAAAAPENGEDLNLHDLLRTALSHAKFIGYVTLAFIILGLAYAFFWPKTYEATTTVKVPDVSQSAQGMLRQLVPFSGSGDPIETYVQVCQSQTVAEDVAQALHLNTRPEYEGKSPQEITKTLLKSVIKVTNVKTSNVLSITARSRDPKLSADLANAWAQSFIKVNLDLSHRGAESKRVFLEDEAQQMRQRLANPDLRLNDESKADELIYAQLLQELQQAQIEAKVNDAGIVVVDSAEVPEKPVSPKKLLSLLLALLLGLAAGLQGAFFLERVQDRVKEEEPLRQSTGLPNYAVVPNFHEEISPNLEPAPAKEKFSPKFLIQNPLFQHSFYRESFKILRTNLTLAQADKPLKALAVLSPGQEEGKTLLNANLAVSLAQGGRRTLLVDADFRKSSVRKVFGLENGMETGLPLALIGQKAWREMVRPSGVEGLDLLPNTLTPPNPAELLGSEAMKRLIAEMKAVYDFVVFDGAPILAVTDSVVLSTLLDGLVLMARFNVTHSSNMRRALEHLKRVGAKVVGTALNDVPVKKGLYGYGYGYGHYQYSYRDEKEGAAPK
jgi:capsular exopolysaccharide synthesis family protein